MALPTPSAGAPPSAAFLLKKEEEKNWGAFGSGKGRKIGAPMVPQMVLTLPLGHGDSEYVLSFEIGQRKGGFYSGRTDRRTNPPSTVLVYRLYSST